MDAATADEILLLKPRDLRAYLQARKGDTVALTDKDLNDAEARLRVVQAYLRWLTEEDLLVHNWDEESYEAALENPDRSYLGHYAQTLAEALVDEPDGYVNHVVGAPPPPVVQPTVVQPTVQQTVWTAAPRGAQPPCRGCASDSRRGATGPDRADAHPHPGAHDARRRGVVERARHAVDSSVATRASRAFSRTGTWTVGQGARRRPAWLRPAPRLGPTEEE